MANQLKIKIYYPKYTGGNVPILKDHENYTYSKKGVGQISLKYYCSSYSKGYKGALVVELAKAPSNKINDSVIKIFLTHNHDDLKDHPKKNKVDLLTGKESVIKSTEDVRNFIKAELVMNLSKDQVITCIYFY